jgi:TolB-like protein/cytochrome c-type biogenesis protein CcmH/NrfG
VADEPKVFAFGDFEVDEALHELRREGRSVEIHATPLRLLLYLLRHRDRVISKEELLDQVWPGTVVSEDALFSALKEIRRALGETGSKERMVETLRGRGYRLIVPVEEQPTTTHPARGDVLGFEGKPAIAVLPFDNLSRDPDQEYFSDGLTDDIITALSRFKDLFVIARNSTFRYKGLAVDVRLVNRELGARYVLEGSVQRAELRLRITVQLLDAKDGTHLWAEKYDRELSAPDIFAVQDEITGQVVGTIAGLSGVISRARFAEVKAKPTDLLDAYECVLQHGSYYRDNYIASEHAKVRAGLERAVESDPDYSEAWARLAFVYADEYRFNYNVRPDPLGRALQAARRAVASDPANQIGHTALAYAHFFSRDLDAFIAAAERAIALNPNDAGTLAGLGELLHYAGEKRGMALVGRALKLDPFHPTWFYFAIADSHFEKGEYEEALGAARKLDMPGFYWTQMLLAAIYAELGRQSEARSAMKELLRLYPGFSVEVLIKEVQKKRSTDDAARRWVAALRKAGLPE